MQVEIAAPDFDSLDLAHVGFLTIAISSRSTTCLYEYRSTVLAEKRIRRALTCVTKLTTGRRFSFSFFISERTTSLGFFT